MKLSRFAPRGSGGGRSKARRYLSDDPQATRDYLRAAREYVSKKPDAERMWLYRKPYDMGADNPVFYQEMYQVLNLLQAMDIAPAGRVLEVGSGPGWVTEILMLLGFEVDAIDPASDMVDIARQRIDAAIEHYRVDGPPRVSFHCQTLEECTLPSDAFDAVFLHESLHHVVDEIRGLEQIYRLLAPGGVVGVSEWAWAPGDVELEAALDEEMRLYGTLENPFTQEYLDRLLTRRGFVEITRYHAVNGLFPVATGAHTIEQVSQAPAASTNNLTARKPWEDGPTSRSHRHRTEAEIEIADWHLDDVDREVTLHLRLRNTGETIWLHSGDRGAVQIALRTGEPGSAPFFEAKPRGPLSRAVPPAATVEVEVTFDLPSDFRRHEWFVDLVNERLFWFSLRGTRAAAVDLPREPS